MFHIILKRLRAWTRDIRGNTALVVALLASLIVCAVGGAVDFSHAYGLRSRLQDATDAGVLAAAIDPSKTEAQMQVIADKAFDENMMDVSYGTATRKLSKTTDAKGNTVLLYTSATQVPTQFLGLIGMDTLPISTLSKSDATIRNTEIAFVLDSTGSMTNSSKMTNLKSSVDTMLASLLDATGKNSANTKVAVVPFDTQVKIDSGINLSHINYGQASNSQSCVSGTNGYVCNVLRDTFNKVCMKASDKSVCKETAKLYYRTYTVGTKVYYEAYAAANYGGTSYTYYDVIYTVTTTGSGGTSTNTETGATTTTTSSSSTATTMVSQTGKSASGTTLYNTAPAPSDSYGAFTSKTSSIFTYSTSYSAGYGYKDAYSASTGAVYTSCSTSSNCTYNGVQDTTTPKTMWLNLPAIAANQSAWTGCVIDRYSDKTKKTIAAFDTSADPAVSTNINSLYPARPCANSNLKAALGLSTDIATARARVQTLTPAGNTNITIGMQWGMEMLSADAPYIGGSAWKTPLYTKYIILVTDGDNTASRDYSGTDINLRTALACQAAKDKGIIIFTVRVMEGDSSMLETCASAKAYYYNLSSASQLGDTMKTILKSIRKIKLAQ